MNRRHLKRLAVGSTVAALTTLGVALSSGGAAAAGGSSVIPNCTKGTNIEAIIDDSGSMSITDPGKFRTKILEAMASLNNMNGKKLGGLEFGTAADSLFAPARIPGVIPAMVASFTKVKADNGSTNYDAAFTLAKTENRTADARIFLTDGAPTTFTPSIVRTPKVKTFVVGIGVRSDPSAKATLDKIASDTGGPAPVYVNNGSQLQPAAGKIAAGINCKKPPLTFKDSFTHSGQTFGHSFKPSGRAADILVSWETSADKIAVSVNGVRKLATVAKAKGTIKKGATFATVHLRGLKKGKKVKFKIKAKQLSVRTKATTQVIR